METFEDYKIRIRDSIAKEDRTMFPMEMGPNFLKKSDHISDFQNSMSHRSQRELSKP